MVKLQFFKFCLFLGLVLFGQMAFGQTKPHLKDTAKFTPSIRIIGKYYGDSVVLRWAPSNAMLWREYNNTGYVIERMEWPEKLTQAPVRQRVSNVPIKPWTLEEWKAKAQRTDSTAAVAAQVLYGKTKLPLVTQSNRGKASDVNLDEALKQKYEMEGRYSIAIFIADNSPFIANGLGLRFVDRKIEKGKVYLYSIHALTDPKKVASDSSAVLIKTTKVDAPPEMSEILYEEHDRKVIFKWSRTFSSHFFTSYFYERSADGGKTFVRNRRPYVQPQSDVQTDDQIILTDSLPQNYKKYYYRIIGVTPFGDLGKPSPAMVVMGKDETPPESPQRITAVHLRKNHVKLTWIKSVKEKDFAGYLVGRSESINGPFKPLNLKLLASSVTTYTDTTAIPWGTNYYVISAVDTANNAGISMPAYVVMVDTIPPTKPIGLHGKIDTTGIVKIKWKLGKERDLMGYLVYSANAKDHAFNPIAKDFLVDSVFTDSVSLNTLTEKIYYKIVAFDKNRNPSPYSEILELKKPDKIPPVAPVFINFSVSDTTVSLMWAASSSADATTQILSRREMEGEWIEIARLTKEKTSYIDTNVKKMTWYEYSLTALDDDGHKSKKSFPLRVRVYDSGVRKKIESLSVKFNPDKRSVDLNWKYPVKDDYYFLIYKSSNKSGLQMYRQVKGETLTMADSHLQQGVYEYAVKAVYKDGAQSPLSNKVRVEVK